MIYLGADHGGFELKETVKGYLKEMSLEYEDLGTHSLDSVDYPEYGQKVAEAVTQKPESIGIVVCGTGIGISISANKVPGARAALCTTSTHARLSKQHNNANILALGGRITGAELAKDILCTFLESTFEGGRHERRVQKITDIESSQQ